MRPRRALPLLVALLVTGACDGGGDGGDGPAGRRATSTTAAPGGGASTTAARPSRPPEGPAAGKPPELRLQSIGTLDQPLALAASARDGDLYVAEKEGRVKRRAGGAWRVVLDLSGSVATRSEQGLLGLAIAPGGAHAYVNYTNREGDTRVVEYAIGDDGTFDTGSARELLAVDQPFANHNGGEVVFGPDGALYVGLGDGGGQGDPDGNAQNPGVLLGKIVRIDVRVPRPRAEVWALGLRNPWRFSFDRESGDVWIGDVGGSVLEEINRSPAGAKGVNYGWDRMEGTHRTGEGPPPDGHVPPVHEYARQAGNCAVTGGYVYRGRAIAGLRGFYLFGDFCRGEVHALRADRPGDATPLGLHVPSLASFGEDGEGELYVLSLQGDVSKVVAA
jgi:glucose/arabinose dehydrogenase